MQVNPFAENKESYLLLPTYDQQKKNNEKNLVNNTLHVRSMWLIAIEKRRPLIGWDTKTRLKSHLHDLCVMLTAQRIVVSKLGL